MNTSLTKHRSTISPFECHHCGLIWYGMASTIEKTLPPGTVLCAKCSAALHNYLYHDGLHCKEGHDPENHAFFQPLAVTWLADRTMKPFPLAADKRFHRSVPRWMRRAIEMQVVEPNDKDVYQVYTREGEPQRVDKRETQEAYWKRIEHGGKPLKKQFIPFWSAEVQPE